MAGGIDEGHFMDPQAVSFEGGPLDGQTRRMAVYVEVIPVGENANYINVNTVARINADLSHHGIVHYVYFVAGKRYDST
jgi:hypothetical protein